MREVGIVDAEPHDNSGQVMQVFLGFVVLEEVAEQLCGLLGDEYGGVDVLL